MKYLKNAVHSMKELPVSLRAALSNRSGEGYVDTAVKILMAVVIGALVLAGLYALFDDTVMPTLTRRIQEMFNYAGGSRPEKERSSVCRKPYRSLAPSLLSGRTATPSIPLITQ